MLMGLQMMGVNMGLVNLSQNVEKKYIPVRPKQGNFKHPDNVYRKHLGRDFS